MKKVIKFLPVMAIVLGSGLAFASNNASFDPNVKNTTPGSGTPNWVPIAPNESVNCNDAPYRECKAYEDEFGNISNIVYGDQI